MWMRLWLTMIFLYFIVVCFCFLNDLSSKIVDIIPITVNILPMTFDEDKNKIRTKMDDMCKNFKRIIRDQINIVISLLKRWNNDGSSIKLTAVVYFDSNRFTFRHMVSMVINGDDISKPQHVHADAHNRCRVPVDIILSMKMYVPL